MTRNIAALGTVAALALSLAACGAAEGRSSGTESLALVLSDSQVTLEGKAVTSGSDGAVTVSHDIVYYQAGMDSDYGEGAEADSHTAEEANAHTVVTIRQPGTYRVSGTLSAGQLAVDLGSGAKTDPQAVVTLILDGTDITCTVAPAVIFYNVYECDTDWVTYDESGSEESYQAAWDVNTSAAGANVILADGSTNHISGSYVARIYQEGTTKKLHKYDGAFYSKMSMNIAGEAEGTGVLNITAESEGLDSELHLTINGGQINIQAQDDGINTNEDGVSVTAINGGTLQINAGLGAEGDGIDSNGYLIINGGNVYTMANDRSPDGGIDAGKDILIHGGYLVALGTRNDAVSADSAQQYMELFFASTLPAGTEIGLSDPNGDSLLAFVTEKACQSITFSSPDLEQNVAYALTVDGVVQQYSGNSGGGFGGGMVGGGGQRPDEKFQPSEPPNRQDAPQRSGDKRPEDGVEPKPGDSQPPEPPDVFAHSNRDEDQNGTQAAGEGSTEFTLTDTVHTFSGISDSAQDSGKTQVTISAEVSVGGDNTVTVSNIQVNPWVDESHIQVSVSDVPSEDYAAACLLSDGDEALAGILPSAPGAYQLTFSVTGDDAYTGTSQFTFTVPAEQSS